MLSNNYINLFIGMIAMRIYFTDFFFNFDIREYLGKLYIITVDKKKKKKLFVYQVPIVGDN